MRSTLSVSSGLCADHNGAGLLPQAAGVAGTFSQARTPGHLATLMIGNDPPSCSKLKQHIYYLFSIIASLRSHLNKHIDIASRTYSRQHPTSIPAALWPCITNLKLLSLPFVSYFSFRSVLHFGCSTICVPYTLHMIWLRIRTKALLVNFRQRVIRHTSLHKL